MFVSFSVHKADWQLIQKAELKILVIDYLLIFNGRLWLFRSKTSVMIYVTTFKKQNQ